MIDDNLQWENEMPEEFRSAIDRVRTRPEPIESLGRSLLAAEGAEMTPAAWKRGQINATLCLVAMIAVFATGTSAISFGFGIHPGVSGIIAGYLLAVIVYLNFFQSWIRARRDAGPVLLDCGGFPARGMFALWVVGFSFLTIASGVYAAQNIPTFRSLEGAIAVAWVALCAAITVYAVIMATGRLQVRANGIWHYFGLLRWQQIESWEWTGKHDATLMFQKKGRFPFLGRGALPVPVEQRIEFEDLLNQNTDRHAPLKKK